MRRRGRPPALHRPSKRMGEISEDSEAGACAQDAISNCRGGCSTLPWTPSRRRNPRGSRAARARSALERGGKALQGDPAACGGWIVGVSKSIEVYGFARMCGLCIPNHPGIRSHNAPDMDRRGCLFPVPDRMFRIAIVCTPSRGFGRACLRSRPSLQAVPWREENYGRRWFLEQLQRAVGKWLKHESLGLGGPCAFASPA